MSFKEGFEGFQAAFKEDPEKAKAVFTSTSRLVEGLKCEVRTGDYSMTVDEPEALGGTNQGPNPVELVLSALGACQEITYRLFADKMEIPVTGVQVEVLGNIDLCGFFAVDDNVRAGYQDITANVTIESTASDEDIQRLKEAVNAHCPVLDIVLNKTPVKFNVEKVASAQAAQ
ncbi:MAG: OsmC family protein [Alphaproteobacteria bacterium]|jgi:putative redox protein|nr:OsmC family protein [Alphaproteobacteria bacterium]MBT7943312.1 OsmC family protein [Alphaproteobacteria bacterium]